MTFAPRDVKENVCINSILTRFYRLQDCVERAKSVVGLPSDSSDASDASDAENQNNGNSNKNNNKTKNKYTRQNGNRNKKSQNKYKVSNDEKSDSNDSDNDNSNNNNSNSNNSWNKRRRVINKDNNQKTETAEAAKNGKKTKRQSSESEEKNKSKEKQSTKKNQITNKNKNKNKNQTDSDKDKGKGDTDEEEEEEEDIDVANNDKSKSNRYSNIKTVCLTGFEDDFGNDLISKGTKLGLVVSKRFTAEGTDITISKTINDKKHPKMTIKLLASLISCKPIIHYKYIIDSYNKNELLDYRKYLCNYRRLGKKNIFSPYFFIFGPTQTKRQKLQMLIQAGGGILCQSKNDQFIMDKNLTDTRILILKNDFAKEKAKEYSKKFNCRTIQENWIIHSVYMQDYYDNTWETDLPPITKVKDLDDYDLLLLEDESSSEEEDSDDDDDDEETDDDEEDEDEDDDQQGN